MMVMKTQDTGCTYQLSEMLAFLSIPSLMDLYLKGFLDTKEKGFLRTVTSRAYLREIWLSGWRKIRKDEARM